METNLTHPDFMSAKARLKSVDERLERQEERISALETNVNRLYRESDLLLMPLTEPVKPVIDEKPRGCDPKKRIMSIIEHNQVHYGNRMTFIPVENYDNIADWILTEFTIKTALNR